jgi:hypothetical protein
MLVPQGDELVLILIIVNSAAAGMPDKSIFFTGGRDHVSVKSIPIGSQFDVSQ